MKRFARMAGCFRDRPDPGLVVHSVASLLGQRVLELALGHEALNDHDELRKDPVVNGVLGCMARNREDCKPLTGKSAPKAASAPSLIQIDAGSQLD